MTTGKAALATAEHSIMKVSVDFSVYTQADGAFGNVSGEISVLTPPQIGDSISFLFPQNGQTIDPSIGFSGVLKVTDRVIAANRDDQLLMLALSDIKLATKIDALKLTEYLEAAFDLLAVMYSE
ncbi:hypothetical protein [Pseudomonas indica]|uniref:hypothetical protein n=1 Tax=Pseudomonas indica TaxID=137658 RepID=UPI0023FA15A1|nr:hypothetical protein [Pseudomonas indica]MBU3058487.1 hypothetical protein [Pseudomonas indica]